MNYDTPPSRFGVVGIDVLDRGNVHYMHEPIDTDAPSERMKASVVTAETETHDQLTTMIHDMAEQDARTGDVVALLQPDMAVERALEVYDIYIYDTSLRPEVAVAEYLYAFTEAVIDPERQDITPEDLESLFSGFAKLLADIDESVVLKA